jgi:glycosyltransferase involved in cell wall biosynthesis
MIPNFSVIVPVFNSESSLEELYTGISAVFQERNDSFEVIFVDDGSMDHGWDILKSLKEKFPLQITAVRLTKNYGQHNATLCGLSLAKGEMLITIDDDLQVNPAEITKMIRTQGETNADLVYGNYGRKKHHAPIRNLGSRTIKKSSRFFHRSPGKGSSFRLITSALAKKLLDHDQHFIYIDEILLWYTDDIAFADVVHQARKYKQSGYSLHKLFKLFGNILLYYTIVPLKTLVYGGFILAVLTFMYGVYFIIKKLVFDVPLGYTSLIVAILFSTSILLFSLGVIGEYLSRIYAMQNKKPPYSIRKVL